VLPGVETKTRRAREAQKSEDEQEDRP
jgi:hypothetical protein